MASRMLVIMNRYNQTGGSNAFLRVFSRTSMVAAMMRGGGGMNQSRWVVYAHAGMGVLVGAGAAVVAWVARGCGEVMIRGDRDDAEYCDRVSGSYSFGLHWTRWQNGETNGNRTGVKRLSRTVWKGCGDRDRK